VDPSYNPINLTSKFLVGDVVYVVADIRNAPKGTHTVCVRWLINGLNPVLPAGAQLCHSIDTSNQNAYFALPILQPAVGTARIYFDRPPGDTDESSHDPALGQTIVFGVYLPAVLTATAAAPTPPRNTPTPVATKSKTN
jgi:hypothetical protein